MMTEDYCLISSIMSALFLINLYHKVDTLDQIDHIIDIFVNFKNRRLVFVF
jgi:hypothetical protein